MSQKQNKKSIQEYAKLVERLSPKSEMGQGMIRAFWVGGLICVIGQAITDCFANVF